MTSILLQSPLQITLSSFHDLFSLSSLSPSPEYREYYKEKNKERNQSHDSSTYMQCSVMDTKKQQDQSFCMWRQGIMSFLFSLLLLYLSFRVIALCCVCSHLPKWTTILVLVLLWVMPLPGGYWITLLYIFFIFWIGSKECPQQIKHSNDYFLPSASEKQWMSSSWNNIQKEWKDEWKKGKSLLLKRHRVRANKKRRS